MKKLFSVILSLILLPGLYSAALSEELPDVKPTAAEPVSVVTSEATPTGGTMPVPRVPKKLEPVVPISSRSYASSIQNIVTGSRYIDIQANGEVADFKVIRLSKPERLAIDVPGVTYFLAEKMLAINKFGISKVRVGAYPEYVRIVLDASKSELPRYTVTKIKDGLRISFT